MHLYQKLFSYTCSYDATKPFKINSPHPLAAPALRFHLSSPGAEIIRSTLDYKKNPHIKSGFRLQPMLYMQSTVDGAVHQKFHLKQEE